MAMGIKSGGTRSNIRVVEPVDEPQVVEDYYDTEVPNTNTSKATSKAPSKVSCAPKNKRKRRHSMDGAEEEIWGVLKVIVDKILEP